MYRLWMLLGICLFQGCYNYEVDTFEKYCERIMLISEGRDQLDQHAPFWAVLRSISFHPDKIRDDYVAVLNKSHLDKVNDRAPRMAWREGDNLHLVNLSSLLVINPEKIIGEWRKGIELAKIHGHKDPIDKCLYETVVDYFDSMTIHSMESDGLGIKWTEEVTTIHTDRIGSANPS
jgi:hypothetical protein